MADLHTLTNLAIVGGETLLGREVRDQLKERKIPVRVQSIGTEENTDVISIEEEEPTVIVGLDEERLAEASMVLLCGSTTSSRRALELLPEQNRIPVVDLTYGLEELPEARLRAPLLEGPSFSLPPGAIHVVAHPAAALIVLALKRVQSRFGIVRSIVQVFEPASERGQAGLTELQKQTSQLLSFQSLTKNVFDAQLSFNLLPRYGSDAPRSLEQVEQLIERHIATLLATFGGPPIPSLRLVQAPVFHGYSFSFWVELEETATAQDFAEALASAQIEVRSADLTAPANADAAGQSGAIAGVIEADRNHPKAFWFWMVADNFRVSADSAVDIVEQLRKGTSH